MNKKKCKRNCKCECHEELNSRCYTCFPYNIQKYFDFVKKLKKYYEEKNVKNIQEELTRYIVYYWYKDSNDERYKDMKEPIEPLLKYKCNFNIDMLEISKIIAYIKYNLVYIDLNTITKKELNKMKINELKELCEEKNIEIKSKSKKQLIEEIIYLKNKKENTEQIDCEYCETDDEECEECNKKIIIKKKENKIEEIKDKNMENKEYKEKDLKRMKITELSKICEEKGFKTDYKRLKKQEYIECILNNKPLRQKKKKLNKREKDLRTLLKLQETYGINWIRDNLDYFE